MFKKRKTYLPILLVLGALIIVGLFIFHNADRLSKLLDFSTSNLVIFILLVFLTAFENGLVNYLLYRNLGVNISVLLGFGLATVNTLANTLPLSGGLIAKGLYLKKKFELPYSKYLSATGALYICFLTTNGIVGLVVMNGLHWWAGIKSPLILNIGFGLMALSFLLFWFPFRVNFIPEKWQKYVGKVEEGWQIFINDAGLLFILIGVQIVAIVTMAFRFWLAFRFFSQDVSFLQCVLFSSATILTRLISIIPGGIGIREGIVAGMAAVFGFEVSISVLAVGLDRLVSTSVIAILGTLFSYILSKDAIEQTIKEKDE